MIDSKRPFAACDKLTPAARVIAILTGIGEY
jgi:hypothetical protein